MDDLKRLSIPRIVVESSAKYRSTTTKLSSETGSTDGRKSLLGGSKSRSSGGSKCTRTLAACANRLKMKMCMDFRAAVEVSSIVTLISKDFCSGRKVYFY